MENTTMAKLYFEQTVNGVTYLRNATTTPGGDQGAKVLQMVKAGHPFWYWLTVPAPTPPNTKLIGCDFTEAPICADTAAEVNAQIAAITMEPGDVLEYGPP